MAAFVQVALNRARSRDEHPRVPRSPVEIAAEARASTAAGAGVLHVHAFEEAGVGTLDGAACAAVLRAIRAVVPGVPVSLTTTAAIEADPVRRMALVAGWSELSELVTANQGEAGIVELCESLIARGVGIEAGLLEPLDAEPAAAVAHAAAMERVLSAASIAFAQVHHGDGIASWAVSQTGPRARARDANRAGGHHGARGRSARGRQRRARGGRDRVAGRLRAAPRAPLRHTPARRRRIAVRHAPYAARTNACSYQRPVAGDGG